MEAIQKAVSIAVATTMKEMATATGGGGGRPHTLQQVVDTTVKRMDRFAKDGFTDWRFKLEMGLRGCMPRLAEILKWSEEQDGVIDSDLMSEEDQGLNHNLYIILAQITTEEAFDVVKNVENHNGVEAFRRLCRRFSGRTRGKRLQMIRRSVNPTKVKKLGDVMGMIEKWENNLRRLQADFKEELSNGLRTGILLEMMPGDVAEHLSQKVNDDDKYEDVKEMVLRYIETRADCEGTAMDIGAVNQEEEFEEDAEEEELYYVKGKGKGACHTCGDVGHFARECPKGLAKGKGKEKGKGKFNGTCWVCGEVGHSSRYCPKGGFNGFGKKGGGKGYVDFGKGYNEYGKGFADYGKGGWHGQYMKGKGKSWGAYGVWDDSWGEWGKPQAEHLPLCSVATVEKDFKDAATLPHFTAPPPGLKLHNMFQDLMEDDFEDDELGEEGGPVSEESSGVTPGEGVLGPASRMLSQGGIRTAKAAKGTRWMKYKDCQNVDCCTQGLAEDYEMKMDDTEIMALFHPDEEVNHIRAEKKWAKLEAVVDSGAAESVAPAAMAPWVPARPSEGSKRGQCYMSANGAKLPNLGEKHFSMVTTEGNLAEATFQVAEVTRPLCSVTKICDRGNRVVFDSQGGFVENLATGVQTKFLRQNNVYVMEMYVEEPANTSGFARPRE